MGNIEKSKQIDNFDISLETEQNNKNKRKFDR
jgi:hypothetical protein